MANLPHPLVAPILEGSTFSIAHALEVSQKFFYHTLASSAFACVPEAFHWTFMHRVPTQKLKPGIRAAHWAGMVNLAKQQEGGQTMNELAPLPDPIQSTGRGNWNLPGVCVLGGGGE